MSADQSLAQRLDEGRESEPPSRPLRLSRTEATRDGSRRLAEDADATRATIADLTGVWTGVLTGHTVFEDFFYTAERWFAVCRPPALAPMGSPVPPRVRRLLEGLLLGESQKAAAIAHALANSTVSSTIHHTLRQLGVPFRPSKLPPLLALLGRAAAGLAVPEARSSTFEVSRGEHVVISIKRPETLLFHLLPNAEYEVLCRIVEGSSYADIAVERETALRTVANQVGSLSRRLGVSGRAELIARLLELASRQNEREVGPSSQLGLPGDGPYETRIRSYSVAGSSEV